MNRLLNPDVPSEEYEASERILFRTPLLPFENFASLCQGCEGGNKSQATDEDSEGLYDSRCQVIRDSLRRVVSQPYFQEALYFASADLSLAVDDWANDPETKSAKRTERALIKYFSRMASRATPFGLFAGCSVASIGARTRLPVCSMAEVRRFTRIDFGRLRCAADAIATSPELHGAVMFSTNPSLYIAGGRLRYIRSVDQGERKLWMIAALEEDQELREILGLGQRGATIDELVNALRGRDVTAEDAREYVLELIQNQVLVSRLQPCVTGSESANQMAEDLKKSPAGEYFADIIEATLSKLKVIDRQRLGVPIREYEQAEQLLSRLPMKTEKRPPAFRTDLFKPDLGATLGTPVIEEIKRGIDLLRSLVPQGSTNSLEAFRERFLLKYGDAEVPLLVLLDEEVGVEYETSGSAVMGDPPLLRGLHFKVQEERKVRWGSREQYLLRKLHASVAAGERSISLSDSDVRALSATKRAAPPTAFVVAAAVSAASEQALDKGDFTVLVGGCDGPSGAKLLGRFCHGDRDILRLTLDHLQAEELADPSRVFAEIVHDPGGRGGNVVHRPVLRRYEIPCFGRSLAGTDREIALADLTVAVRDKRIILRSRRLGAEVIPRLTCAHFVSARKDLRVYHFLHSLQFQGEADFLQWNWQPIVAPFLPRIACGRVILSLASWILEKEDLAGLDAPTSRERFRAMRLLRRARGLPRFIRLADGDNLLTTDLENPLSVEALAHTLAGRRHARLLECFPEEDRLIASNSEGHFFHELFVPFIRRADPPQPVARRPMDTRAEDAFFLPGSEWLQVNVYCSRAACDRILRASVGPLVGRAIRLGAVSRWFFVRYGDPAFHLRLRFNGDPSALREELLPDVHRTFTQLAQGGFISRIQFDTYQPEVGRYGGSEAMRICEDIFHADSVAALELLGIFAERGDDELPWRAAILGIHAMLDAFHFDLSQRARTLAVLEHDFGARFDLERSQLRHELGAGYRQRRGEVENLLLPGGWSDGAAGSVDAALTKRGRALDLAFERLKSLASAGRLRVGLEELAGSLVHMQLNRFLSSAQNAQEVVIYDWMRRAYLSLNVRASESLLRR
jgi:class I lanthipeptide synthase